MTTIDSDARIIDRLRAVFDASDQASTHRLHSGLGDRADSKGLLDIAYHTVDSPLGPLLLAATEEGLVRVAFDCENHDAVLMRLATDISPRILHTPRRLDHVVQQLAEYFAEARRTFDLRVDLRLASGFRRSVLDHLRAIPYGTTQSYAAVARASGRPNAVRAVGSACSHNPVPVVVPCHRVVRSNGTIGEYAGGTDAKRALLEMEARP